MKIKQLLLTAILFFSGVSAFTLPGVVSQVKDTSGEYVFYRDLSFKEDAVVGFLFYDESTYAIRFYSAKEKKDITVYLSINPENKALEFTGETISGMTSQEDSDIVNYLHDLFYEFTERRQKIELDGLKFTSRGEDFAQFGGSVTVTYSQIVPVFNLVRIEKKSGETLFSLVTKGILTDSSDTSFADFKGVSSEIPQDKKRPFELKAGKKLTATYGIISFELDENWQQGMENLWLLGESALITVMSTAVPEGVTSSEFILRMLRTLTNGSAGSYYLAEHFKQKAGDTSVSSESIFYQSDFNNVTRDFQVLAVTKQGQVKLCKLTVFDSVYRENKKYFDSIVKSFPVE